MNRRPDPERAGEPFRCCLCGQDNPRGLCRRCRLAHTIDGALAPWVAALKRETDRLTARERRWRGRVTVLSLDALDEREAS